MELSIHRHRVNGKVKLRDQTTAEDLLVGTTSRWWDCSAGDGASYFVVGFSRAGQVGRQRPRECSQYSRLSEPSVHVDSMAASLHGVVPGMVLVAAC